MEYWINKNGLAYSTEFQEKAGLDPTKAAKIEETRRLGESKFAFDSGSGAIRQALENEKGITLAEAEMLQGKWRADHPNARNDGDDKEPKMIQDTNGNWILNPNAKNLTPGDLAYLEGLRPKPDSVDLITMGSEKKKQLMEELGLPKPGGSGGASSLDETIKLFGILNEPMKLQMTQISNTLAEAMKTMTAAIEKIGQPKGEDPALKEIKDELKTEREERHKLEIKQSTDALTLERQEREKLSTEVQNLKNRPPAGAKDVPDLISEVGAGVIGELKGLREVFGPAVASKITGTGGGTLPKQTEKIIIAGIKEAGKDAANIASGIDPRVRELAAKNFGKG
jgi:hypothetical protein